jgi:hypothetical protein
MLQVWGEEKYIQGSGEEILMDRATLKIQA